MGESAGEHPPFLIAMSFVEPGNVIYDPHPPHLRADRFELAGRELVFFTKRAEIRNKLALGIFQLDEDRQEDLLLVPTARKQQSCQLIQVLDPGNLVAAELNLCPRHKCLPHPFRPKHDLRRGVLIFR